MENGKIYSAISAAMADIGAIGKDKVNTQQGFKFRGIDDVMNALKPILTKHQIFTAPEILEQTREVKVTKTGGELRYSLLKIRFRFYADDGSYIDAVTLGEGMDSGDKASNKAMAIAYKYALFQVFCIPTEEMTDPDAETPPETQHKPQGSKPAKQGNQPESITQYIMRRCSEIGITMGQLSEMRESLVKGGVIKGIPTKDMNMDDAKALMAAVESNFAGAA